MEKPLWDFYNNYTDEEARAAVGDVLDVDGKLAKDLDASDNYIKNLPNPVDDYDASTKKYVDDAAGGTKDAAHIGRASSFSLSSGTYYQIDFGAGGDEQVEYDYGGLYDPNHTDYLTIQKDGLYLISSYVKFTGATGGYRRIMIRGGADGTTDKILEQTSWSITDTNVRVKDIGVVPCNAGDKINLQIYQNSGSTHTIYVPIPWAGLWVTQVR
jgi:hypothetical protein